MVLKTWTLRATMVLALATAACSPDRGSDELFAPTDVGIPVVDATLVVGQRLPNVVLTRTLAPGEPFSLARAGILGATVTITITGDDLTVPYAPLPSPVPGVYGPLTSILVRENTTYRLTAVLPDGHVVRATTTTPVPIRVREWVLLDNQGENVIQTFSRFEDFPESPDTLWTLDENQLEYPQGIVEIRLESDPAVAFQVGLQSLDLDSRFLIDADFLEEDDLDEFTRYNDSPPLEAVDRSLRVPWFAIYFEGRYKMRVFSMDRNWFDLARTDPVLGGGGFGFGGEAGDTTVRPIFNIDGGIGLFASMSYDSIGFFVRPPSE